jgi:hypothetical protein
MTCIFLNSQGMSGLGPGPPALSTSCPAKPDIHVFPATPWICDASHRRKIKYNLHQSADK